MNKPPTVFIDIDGLLLMHSGQGASEQWYSDVKPVEGAVELLDEMEARGWCVILVTARKQCVAEQTVRLLEDHSMHYDQILFGITSGLRVVLNDSKSGAVTTAAGITFTRNKRIDVKETVCNIEKMGAT